MNATAAARTAIASYRKSALKGSHNPALLARAALLAAAAERETGITLTELLEEVK